MHLIGRSKRQWLPLPTAERAPNHRSAHRLANFIKRTLVALRQSVRREFTRVWLGNWKTPCITFRVCCPLSLSFFFFLLKRQLERKSLVLLWVLFGRLALDFISLQWRRVDLQFLQDLADLAHRAISLTEWTCNRGGVRNNLNIVIIWCPILSMGPESFNSVSLIYKKIPKSKVMSCFFVHL